MDGRDANERVTSQHGQPTAEFKSFDDGRGFVDVLESATEDERRLIIFNMFIKLIGLPYKNPESDYGFTTRLSHFRVFVNSAELRLNHSNALEGTYIEQLNRTLGTFIGGVAMAT